MSVLMRRENTLIIEPGSDISKIQIINFILLPNSKKHFEGPPLYENPDSQRVILNNLFKKTYEYIYPFSYKDFTLIFSLPSVSLILAKAGCTVSDFESSELALVNLVLDNYEPLQNEIFEFLLQMEIQKSSSEIQLLRQIGAKMFTQKPPKMESARRPVSGKRSGRNYGAEEQVLARFGVLAFALVLSGCEMNEDMEWE
ncbi:Hypothetical_protein [Hexamita inflata]|uniref:Hypothetical_protein n=1 Tax=Hexamita inflata TaxID=28002 RepID=A0ABP1HQF5_9EUKA